MLLEPLDSRAGGKSCRDNQFAVHRILICIQLYTSTWGLE